MLHEQPCCKGVDSIGPNVRNEQVAKVGIIPEPAGSERPEVCCSHMQPQETPVYCTGIIRVPLESCQKDQDPFMCQIPVTEWGKSASVSSVGGVSRSGVMSYHPEGNGPLRLIHTALLHAYDLTQPPHNLSIWSASCPIFLLALSIQCLPSSYLEITVTVYFIFSSLSPVSQWKHKPKSRTGACPVIGQFHPWPLLSACSGAIYWVPNCSGCVGVCVNAPDRQAAPSFCQHYSKLSAWQENCFINAVHEPVKGELSDWNDGSASQQTTCELCFW